MTMGQYIKYLREELHMSQEELGQSLKPPVNRAAVQKWETGQVENIKRCHIQQLSEKFGIKPSELMCFDDRFDSPIIAEEVKTIEMVQKNFGDQAVRLLKYFELLNELGKKKTLDDVQDLSELTKYQKGQD